MIQLKGNVIDIYEQEQNDTSSSISSYRYQFIDELIDKVIDKKALHLRLRKNN